MSWKINLGFVEVGSAGFDVKPKFEFGADVDGHGFNAGVGDVRNGLKIGASAGSTQHAEAEGSDIAEFVNSLKFTGAALEAFNIDKIISLITSALSDVTKMTGIDSLVGGHVRIKGKCECTLGLGVSGEVALGWKDTEGFHMIGGGGKVLAGATVMAGKDYRNDVKLIIGVAYGPFFKFDIIVRKL